ncbi:MAG: CHAT domain-containing protein, partial [Planctomycetota bacterium]
AARAKDPWLEADDILGSDGLDAAVRFAADVQGPDADALRKYLMGAPPLEPEARRALVEAYRAFKTRRFQETLDRLATVKAPTDTILQAQIWRLRAEAHAGLGAAKPLLDALRRSRGIAENIGWLKGEAVAAVQEGRILQTLLRYEKLIELYEELEKLQKRRQESLMANEARLNRACSLTEMGRLREALAILPSVIEAARKNNWEDHEAAAHATMAAALSKRAEYARSLEHAERAEELWESFDAPSEQANCAMSAGTAFWELGDLDAAEAAYRRAQKLLGEGGSFDHIAVRANLGLVAWRRGHHEKALQHLHVAVAALEKRKDWVQVAVAHSAIGEIQNSQGEYAKARESFDRAVKHLKGDPLRRVEALAEKARACLLAGDVNAAQSVLKTALATKGGDQGRLARIKLFRVEGEILLARNKPADALASFRKAIDILEDVASGLSDEQTLLAREQRARVFQVAVKAAFRANKDILEFLERGRAAALRDAIGSRRTLQRSHLPRALAKRLEAAEDDVVEARLTLEFAQQAESLSAEANARAKLAKAEERLRELNNQAERKHKRLAAVTRTRPSSMREIQACLRSKDVLVYYALQDDAGHAFLLTRKDARPVTLKNAEKIPALCEEARKSLATKGGTGAERIEGELKALLVKPLRLTRESRVIVCPDGPLSYLPWPKLLDKQYGSSVPSGSTLVLLRDPERKPGTGILALGDPDYSVRASPKGADRTRGGPLTSLPESGKEVEGIKREMAGSKAFVGKKATEASLERELPSRRWRAVHFACHGLIDDRFPRRSSLALTRDERNDGFLTIPEIVTLDVRADLVVLSACRTGRGRYVGGEGVVGLTRAFMAAGAPLVLASTWKVDDAATRKLMVRFYREWRKDRVTAAEALRRAQRYVASQEGWDHPYYWAAWVLWGAPE